MKAFRIPLLAASLSLLSLAAGCSGGDAADVGDGEEAVEGANGIALCAAVRGNGENIGAHFASLAHIVETYGTVGGMAGGSSGSITSFLYESILSNDAVNSCGKKACNKAERSARVALALKSIHGYGGVVATSDEAVAIRDVVSTVGKLKEEAAKAKALDAVGDAATLASRLTQVLSVPEIRGAVNPELFEMLRDVPHLAFNVGEIQTSIKTLGAFSVDHNRLFFRPGVLNWATLAELFGRVGSFYAGYAPASTEQMSSWLDACSTATTGKSWEEASQVAMPSGGTCGDAFSKMVVDYRAAVRAAAPGTLRSRLDDKVGAGPLHKLVSTAVLEGNAVKAYEAATRDYRAGKFPTGPIASFTPGDQWTFEDVRFGYWGGDAELARLAQARDASSDEKTRKASSLGSGATWREILQASPAEPGLSHFVKLADGRYSAGGWSDLAPVLALDAIGCKRVVYVTRQGDESGFATQIAQRLGMNEVKWKALYDLSNGESSYSRSVAKAAGVWCTNWNAFQIAQQRELAADAWSAPLELHALANDKPLRPYANTSRSLGLPGCTPGASGGATFPAEKQ